MIEEGRKPSHYITNMMFAALKHLAIRASGSSIRTTGSGLLRVCCSGIFDRESFAQVLSERMLGGPVFFTLTMNGLARVDRRIGRSVCEG